MALLFCSEFALGLISDNISVGFSSDDFGEAVAEHPATQKDRVKLSGSFASANGLGGTSPARTESFARNQGVVWGRGAVAVVVREAGSSGVYSMRHAHKTS